MRIKKFWYKAIGAKIVGEMHERYKKISEQSNDTSFKKGYAQAALDILHELK